MTKQSTLIALAALLSAGAAGAQTLRAGEAAFPEDGPVPLAAPAAPATRASVVAALAQARRDGELVAPGELGLAPAELHSEQAVAYGRSRQDVQAELAQARRSGELIAGESSLTLREQFPFRYGAPETRTLAARQAADGNTR
jgi:hypothetical protein